MKTEELKNYSPKGELEGFPKEIIARMLDCQQEQGNPRDISVFEKRCDAGWCNKGFDWDGTQEGFGFWEEVIDNKNFNIFFEQYPQKDNQDNSQKLDDLETYTPKGELEGFPKEIIAKMLDCQEEQGNPRDVSVFEENVCVSMIIKGFDWNNTKDEFDFWEQVISERNFNLFFEKYPKQDVRSECKKQEHQESKTDKYVQVDDNAILSDITPTQSSVEIEINTTEESSQEFKVGDEVINIITGRRGKISQISTNVIYVNFNGKGYTLDGRCYIDDKYPHLLHYRDDYNYNVIDFNNLPKRQNPKRWRAEMGKEYYFVDFQTKNCSFSNETKDDYVSFDNDNYNSGNYFRTEVEAETIAQKLNEYFKQLIQKEHE